MRTVYVESSIFGYLRQRPSGSVVTAARQVLTQRWWNTERGNYENVISQYVVDEVSAGNPELAAERLRLLEGLPVLPPAPAIQVIARAMVARAILPPKAEVDALHVAAAAHHGIDYVLTWNCSHIANARILPAIRGLLDELGVAMPFVCTPEEFVGNDARF